MKFRSCNPRLLLALVAIVLAAGCTPMPRAGQVIESTIREGASTAPLPRTRAERSNYTETSRHADVVAFLEQLQGAGVPLWLGTIGSSAEGREIPYVIASRPLVTNPAEARRLGRPVVWVQGNIHAGEVEGKEALLALLRDLTTAGRANVLDSIVLIAIPIYNADGNERLGPQERNRGEQNGPAIVGERANGQGLDLNRDYIKAEAPETRASLAMFRRWDPDVFVDLHTTNGSYHGYALTYSPSLNPAAFSGGVYARDSLLPELRRRVRRRHGLETFDYGNFALQYGADYNTDTVRQAWYSYDHRPRFGTNYYGLRGRIAVLSEAYSHDPFERRVRATYQFVFELLSLVAERGAAIVARSADADRHSTARRPDGIDSLLPVRGELTRNPHVADVIGEDLARADSAVRGEPGVPRGLRRTGRFRTMRIPVYDRFDAALRVPLQHGWALRASDTAAVRLLRAHGVVVEQLREEWKLATLERYAMDSVVVAARPFQGHHEVLLSGHWRRARSALPAGSWIVRAAQPLVVVAAWLLEPESDDGLATWNVLDPLRAGDDFPIARIAEPVRAATRVVD